MDHNEITMCPNIIVFLEVGREVTFTCGVVPEKDGHVWKCERSDEFAGCAVLDGGARYALSTFNEGIVDCNRRTESGTLSSAYIDWGEWIFLLLVLEIANRNWSSRNTCPKHPA